MTRPAPSTHRGHSKPPERQEFLNPNVSKPQCPTRDLQAGIAQDSHLEKPLPTAASKWSPSDQAQGQGIWGCPWLFGGTSTSQPAAQWEEDATALGFRRDGGRIPFRHPRRQTSGAVSCKETRRCFGKGEGFGGPPPSTHHPREFGISSPFPEQRGRCSRMLPGDWGGMFSQGGDTAGSRMGTVTPGAIPVLVLLLSRLFLGSPRCSWEAEAALPVARPDPHEWHWGQSAWPGKNRDYGRHWDHGRQLLGATPAATTPSSYLVGAEAGGPAPEIGGGHGDAEFQDGEDEQHDGNPIPCELQDGENPISTPSSRTDPTQGTILCLPLPLPLRPQLQGLTPSPPSRRFYGSWMLPGGDSSPEVPA